MYTTCLHCQHDLGRNESLELFPVGRRLAFDQAKGRLWVICTTCGRWNLTPMEERWEAIEGCEKLFRDTVLRASTDNIGLARLTSGLELIRVGRPQFPEYASWRYADKFRRRRNGARLAGLIGVAGYVAVAVVLPELAAAAGITIGGGTFYGLAYSSFLQERRQRRPLGKATLQDGSVVEMLRAHAEGMTLSAPSVNEWRVELPTVHRRFGTTKIVEAGRPRFLGMPSLDEIRPGLPLSADESRRILGRTSAIYNSAGGTSIDVRYALEVFEETKGEAVTRVASYVHRQVDHRSRVRDIPVPVRLALEMQLSETNERRWLDGELYLLESAWEEAEKLAAIADALMLPGWVSEKLGRLKGSGR